MKELIYRNFLVRYLSYYGMAVLQTRCKMITVYVFWRAFRKSRRVDDSIGVYYEYLALLI